MSRDLVDFFAAQVPEDTTIYRHIAEGADEMPAHVKGAVTQTHIAIPVCDCELLLNRYQGRVPFEHRRTPRPGEIIPILKANDGTANQPFSNGLQ